MPSTSAFTAGDGCRIAYRLDGSPARPVLVLSNSIATNLHMWDGEVDALAQHFSILRYDTRGHGESDSPAGAYSLDRLGWDVVELLDHLGLQRVHFCGLSLGGFVGQWLGIHAPERLDRLVLSNTSPYLGPSPQWDELIRRTLGSQDLSSLAPMFLGNWFPAAMWRTDPEVIERFKAMILATRPDGLAGCFAVVRDSDLRRTIALIERPVLVIGGSDDSVTLASHSQAIAERIPGAVLRIFPGVHMLNVERREDFLAAVTDFLCKQEFKDTSNSSLSKRPSPT
jgi:3-oxoadipate enol-lactonase